MRFGIAYPHPVTPRGVRLTEDCSTSLLCTNMSK